MFRLTDRVRRRYGMSLKYCNMTRIDLSENGDLSWRPAVDIHRTRIIGTLLAYEGCADNIKPRFFVDCPYNYKPEQS